MPRKTAEAVKAIEDNSGAIGFQKATIANTTSNTIDVVLKGEQKSIEAGKALDISMMDRGDKSFRLTIPVWGCYYDDFKPGHHVVLTESRMVMVIEKAELKAMTFGTRP